MKRLLLLSLTSVLLLNAELVQIPVGYELEGTKFSGHLIYDSDVATDGKRLPGIFMVPNWMGPDTAGSLEKARKVAGDEFAVFVADMYGVDVRPTNSKESGAAAGFVRGDRELMRARAHRSIQVFKALAEKHPINSDKMLGIGFCFGGGTLLEYARTGSRELNGIVSFHGDLMSPTLEADAKAVKTPLLILHGANDPYVPQEDVQAFVSAMQEGEVDDWTLVQFSGAVHSFTNPEAQSDGSRYHARTAKRAFEMMDDFAEEVLELEK